MTTIEQARPGPLDDVLAAPEPRDFDWRRCGRCRETRFHDLRTAEHGQASVCCRCGHKTPIEGGR